MNTPGKHLWRGLALAVLMLTFVSTVQAQDAQQRRGAPGRRSATFAVSGVYSGTMAGQVTIEGASFLLAPTARVYQVGVGMVSLGAIPIGTRVYAMGQDLNGLRSITGLIARPTNETEAPEGDKSKFIKVKESPSEL